MGSNPQFPADLVTFTEEILNGKLHFLCSVNVSSSLNIILLFYDTVVDTGVVGLLIGSCCCWVGCGSTVDTSRVTDLCP